jgi:hypothetical protein
VRVLITIADDTIPRGATKGLASMALMTFLAQKQSTIVNRWFDLVMETYPLETARLFKKETNRFANPVGSTTLEGLKEVFAVLLKGFDAQQLTPALDKIIRIRAIQDFTPAVALRFGVDLKSIVREELAEPIAAGQVTADELHQLDQTADQLLLLAFNIYMQCREELYELRVREVRNQSARLLQRANILWTAPEQQDNS